MKIAFLELEGWEEDIIRKRLSSHELYLSRDVLNEKILNEIKDIDILSVFINSKVDCDTLKALSNLRAIVTRSTGYDHIDVNICTRRGIKVYNIPDYGSNTVAVFTFLLILSLMRMIQNVIKYEATSHIELRGHDLKNKIIGVLGTGRIGTYVIKLAHAFGMKILAYDKYPKEELVKKYQVEYVDLETILKNSDIITLHLPYFKETHHIINSDNIKLIKEGVILVNTSRGGLIETKAIIEALESGKLNGVALDVIEAEKIMKFDNDIIYGSKTASFEELKNVLAAYKLKEYPQVILTPHIAYNTWEAVNRILEKTLTLIEEIARGKWPEKSLA